MKLRLKRISKLNIVVAVFVSILLLFCNCVCPYLFVYASNSGVSKYLHGSQYFTKNGYYFEQSDYVCGSDFCSSPTSYECSGHCFDASGMPGFATDSVKKKFNSFLSSVGVDLSGLDLYFVLYERPTDGRKILYIRVPYRLSNIVQLHICLSQHHFCFFYPYIDQII